ncbi:coagulation factor VIIi [Brachionichthys hirsutus]|uniref:coagulation factor VIIi n=1 Tax=Brachionichthys hirsutus TaxID=412623 RepID=UPI00360459C1
MLLRSCCAGWILISGIAAAAVFVQRDEANAVLQRWRRANSGFLEEMKQGNMERECVEEICNYEEAREVFEDDDRTRQFWRTYNRSPCSDDPCRNNGTCEEMGQSFNCLCPEGFLGDRCELRLEDWLKCLNLNGHCQHFCDGSGQYRKCSCADGYELGADGRQCIPRVEYPCGKLAPEETGTNQSMSDQTRLVGASHCPKGECPWQVLVQLHGQSHCGGVLIDPDWVVTAAHCVSGKQAAELTVVAGEHNLDVEEGTEQRMPVSMVITHEHYVPETGDSDVGLLRLRRPITLTRHAIPVCLPTQDLARRELLPVRFHAVSGWGGRTSGGNEAPDARQTAQASPVLRRFSVPIHHNLLCSQVSRFNFTENMLCAGYLEGQQESCRGDDGSPLVTEYGSTHFLTGVAGWGKGCPQPGYYGVYNFMGNFVHWVKSAMATAGATPTQEAAAALFDMPEQKILQ